jgi:hypothetical protein
MTAIVGIQTSEGFAFGADGLTKNELDQTISIQTRKVFFATKPPDYNFAYAWCGRTALNLRDGFYLRDGWFDFFETSANVLDTMRECSFPISLFFDLFANEVFARLASRLNGNVLPAEYFQLTDELLACACFAGYLNGTPVVKQILFNQRNHQLQSPILHDPNEFSFGKTYTFCGPPDQDNSDVQLVFDLGKGIQAVGARIQECIQAPRGNGDLEYGGCIHIAKVTHGTAAWADGFAPEGG